MLDTKLSWRRNGRRITACAISLSAGAFSMACDDAKDDTDVMPRGGSSGGGAGGSSGGGAGGSLAGTAGSAVGGAGDTTTEDGDAGPDAATPGEDCVVGTLEQYCSVASECPELGDARSSLRTLRGFPLTARVIVQRPCTAPNGAGRISVSADYRSASLTYIYDAATEALVGVELIDDLGLCSGAGVEFGDAAFGQVSGYYGEESRDCGSGFPRFNIPAACGSFDAGAPDAGPDAGPSECILTEPSG